MYDWGMPARLTAPVSEQGITLVDHENDAFDDGQIGYLSFLRSSSGEGHWRPWSSLVESIDDKA